MLLCIVLATIAGYHDSPTSVLSSKKPTISTLIFRMITSNQRSKLSSSDVILGREQERPEHCSVLLAGSQCFQTQLNWGFMWNHLFMVCQTPAYPSSLTLLKHCFCLVLTFKIRFYFFLPMPHLSRLCLAVWTARRR